MSETALPTRIIVAASAAMPTLPPQCWMKASHIHHKATNPQSHEAGISTTLSAIRQRPRDYAEPSCLRAFVVNPLKPQAIDQRQTIAADHARSQQCAFWLRPQPPLCDPCIGFVSRL